MYVTYHLKSSFVILKRKSYFVLFVVYLVHTSLVDAFYFQQMFIHIWTYQVWFNVIKCIKPN